jgi:hypothetical protein
MIELLIKACVLSMHISSPEPECRDFSLLFDPHDVSLMTCMMQAQPIIAQWKQALAMRDAGKEREQHLRTVHASRDSEPADRKSLQVASESHQSRHHVYLEHGIMKNDQGLPEDGQHALPVSHRRTNFSQPFGLADPTLDLPAPGRRAGYLMRPRLVPLDEQL